MDNKKCLIGINVLLAGFGNLLTKLWERLQKKTSSQITTEKLPLSALSVTTDQKDLTSENTSASPDPIPIETPKTSDLNIISVVQGINTPKVDEAPIKPNSTPIQQQDKRHLFIKSLKIAIQDGFDPLIPYCQAVEESGNFKKLVGNFNYFGLVKPERILPPISGWLGKTVNITTHEYEKGIKKEYIRTFCDFSNADDCMFFYIYQIRRLYKMAYANRNFSTGYFTFLVRGDRNSYATNPEYAESLLNIYKHLKATEIYEEFQRIIT